MPITYYPTYKNSSGNVGIGNINPSYRLDVKAITANGSTVFVIRNANDSNNVAFYDNGTVSAGSDFRAPIFYDSSNTAYYVDPASTSNLNSITLNNSGSSGYLTLPGSVTVSNVSSSEIVLRNLTQLRFSTSTSWDWNAWAGLKYDYSASTIYLGGPAASGGVFTANATPPSVTVSFIGTSNVTSDSNIKAPIFYDSNDTTYYLDPANSGTSMLVAGKVGVGASSADTNLQVVGHVHVGNQTTFENTGGWNKTIYLDGTVHARLRILGSAYASGKNSATETYLWVDNSASPYSGLATNAGSFQISAGYTTVLGSARSPIFYDSDNTAYYVDPASTSNLVGLTVSNTITGNITGSSASASYLTGGDSAFYGILLNNTSADLNTVNNAGLVSAEYIGSTNNPTGSVANGHFIQISDAGGTDVKTQWYYNNAGSDIYMRLMWGNANWKSWRKLLHDGNYSGYSTFSGSVTSTYGNFTTPGLIIGDAQYGFYVVSGNVYYKSASGGVHYWRNTANSANVMSLDNSGNIINTGYINASSYIYTSTYLQTGNNNIYPNGLTNTLSINVGNSANNAWVSGISLAPGGLVTAYGDMRSPIFYDSNNTAYYADPASTSVLNRLTIDGGNYAFDYFQSLSDFTNGTLVTTDIPASAANGLSFVMEVVGKSYNTTTSPFNFNVQGYLYNSTIINYSGMSLDSTGLTTIKVFENGGFLCFWWARVSYWNAFEVSVRSYDTAKTNYNRVTNITDAVEPTGTKKVTVTLQKFLRADVSATNSVDLRAPIFYDSDNTSYALDPASISNLNVLGLAGYVDVGTYIYLRNNLRMLNSAGNAWLETIVRNSGSPYFTNPIDGGTFLASDVSENNNWIFQEAVRGWGLYYFNKSTQSGQTFGSYTTIGAETFIIGQGTGTTMPSAWTGYNASSKVAIMLSHNTGYIWANGTVFSATDLRGPVFYDSDNTSYYVDAAGTSTFNAFTGSHSGGSVNVTSVNGAYIGVNNTTNTNGYGLSLYNGAQSGAPTYGIMFQGTATFGTHGSVTSDWATYFTMNNDNSRGWIFRKAGTANTASITAAGLATFDDSVRSPIFYDSNNTSYYIDAASSSVVNSITSNDYYTNGWFRSNVSGYGIYNQITGEHFYSDDSSYWNVASSSTVQGIRFRTGGYNGTIRGYIYANDSNDIGLLNSSGNWRVRIVGGDYLLADGSSIRGQIFYDTNNTAYYCDPAGTSVLNNLTISADANLELYKSQTVDMSNTTTYSTSNYYPVTISVPTEGCIIQIQNNLNSNVPSWSTHASGFTLNLKWRTNGSGWGTTTVRRIIDQYTEGFTNLTICGGITQMTNSSTEVVWLRGGGQYLFKFSRNLSATAQATTYTASSQSVSPTSTAQNTIWDSYSGNEIKYNTRTISTSDMYTPILYDWSNSSYYVDPAGTSVLNGLTIGGNTALTTASTLTAGNLSGTIPSGVLGNSTHYIGTTAIALNRGSASQSLTGVNIDGSSGSCTGNAATATTTDNINGRAFYNRDSGNGLGQDSYTNNGIGYVTGVTLFGQTDGGFYTSAYSTSWIHQIYGDFRTGQIAARGKNNGTWQSWRTILDSSNYTAYSSFQGTVYGTGFISSSDSNYYLQPTNLSSLWTVRANNFYSNQVSVTATASTTINTIYNVTQLTLSASVTTLTFSGIQSSTITTMWTVVVLGQGSAYSITWPTAVKWPGGTAPTLTTTLNKRDIYQFLTYDGGTTIYAIIVGQNL